MAEDDVKGEVSAEGRGGGGQQEESGKEKRVEERHLGQDLDLGEGRACSQTKTGS